MKKLSLAIIGQGRSGKDIHGAFLLSPANTYFDVAYIVETDARRRKISAERYPGAEILSDYTELFGKKVDLVVNASYSEMHYPISRDLLAHGFNVLSEKPIAATLPECDTLIKLAKDKGVLYQGFHNTLFAPYFLFLRDVMTNGIIGEVKQISVRFNGFSRRWDWQTLQKKVGGNAYNTGPHPIGIALGLLGFDPETRLVWSSMASTPFSAGDADDYVKMILAAPGKPVADVEISSLDAFSDWNVKLQGTRGTVVATTGSYRAKYILEGENPPLSLVEGSLQDENGNPLYCSEKLTVHEAEGTFDGDAFNAGALGIYRNLYEAITEGKPLILPPEKTRQIIRVIEAAHAENPLARVY